MHFVREVVEGRSGRMCFHMCKAEIFFKGSSWILVHFMMDLKSVMHVAMFFIW